MLAQELGSKIFEVFPKLEDSVSVLSGGERQDVF